MITTGRTSLMQVKLHESRKSSLLFYTTTRRNDSITDFPFRHYIGKKKAPDWLKMNFILGYFGKTLSDRSFRDKRQKRAPSRVQHGFRD